MEFVVFKEGKMIKHPKTGEVLDVERILLGRVVITDVRDKIAEAQILEESPPGAIAFGQRVKSVGALVSTSVQTSQEPATVGSASPPSTQTHASGVSIASVMEMLQSSDYTEKTRGAKYVARYYGDNPMLLQQAEKELLAGYQTETRERDYVEAMGWMCNVLGRSRNSQYKGTLEEVSKNASNRRVRGYAKKNMRYLR
jgi:hypothetical protein